ncbi:MAG TPA: L,D-transpeptidase family protein [Chthoniobacterales bacterium]|jgi:lipoprotein-anchoring transpeptidase ErfK/SrfK|nr:L,D-transpeptidase family protein [Chthoniobacterales bacterium]
MSRHRHPFVLLLLLVLAPLARINAQMPRHTPPRPATSPAAKAPQLTNRPKPSPTATQPMKKASDLINKQQAPIATNNEILARVTPDNAHVIVSLTKQRAYLMTGEEIAIDSPISSGKRGHTTPNGSFTVLEKDKDHHSSLYGDYKDSSGRTVRGGISAHIDAAPSGTHFVGASMKWFMRLTGEGVGMHVGILPGYAASHGCIRMPEPAAAAFYAHVKVGTPVRVDP